MPTFFSHTCVAFEWKLKCTCYFHCCSGMLVQDPTKGGNTVDDIFDQARQVAVDAPTENSSRSRSFIGTARLLSGETLESAPQPVESIAHMVTFWRNGFSVNDGPLRRLDDPQNAAFLEVS